MSSFKKSPLAYIDDEIAHMVATQSTSLEALESSPSFTKHLSEAQLKYLAQATFESDLSEYFPHMNWSKEQ